MDYLTYFLKPVLDDKINLFFQHGLPNFPDIIKLNRSFIQEFYPYKSIRFLSSEKGLKWALKLEFYLFLTLSLIQNTTLFQLDQNSKMKMLLPTIFSLAGRFLNTVTRRLA